MLKYECIIVLFKERPIFLKSWVCAVVIEVIDRRGTTPFVDSIRCVMTIWYWINNWIFI